MQRFFSYKINFLFGAVVIVAMAWNIYNIFTNTPMVPDQHWAQKISLGSIAFGMFMIAWGYKEPNVKKR